MTKILIVDDEPLVLLSIKTMLEWSDYDIEIQAEARNGKEAYLYLMEHPEIDIVITDVDMPIMNGLELCEALAAKNATHDFIFLSIFSNYEYVRRAFKSGANDYILKSDLEAKKLLSVLKKMIQRRKEQFGEPTTTESIPILSQSPQKMFLQKCITEKIQEKEVNAFKSLFPDWDFPFCIMIVKPQTIENRSAASAMQFQNAVQHTLLQNIRFEKKAFFSLDVDTYLVFAKTEENLEETFSTFNEMAWMYFSIGFDKYISKPQLNSTELCETLFLSIKTFSSYSKHIHLARRYIQEHYSNTELQLSDIASYVEISKNHLSSEFTKETGETISEYISSVRIRHAKKLLSETNLKIYEVAERVGFSNTETFNRTFKKLTGQTPTTFLS